MAFGALVPSEAELPGKGKSPYNSFCLRRLSLKEWGMVWPRGHAGPASPVRAWRLQSNAVSHTDWPCEVAELLTPCASVPPLGTWLAFLAGDQVEHQLGHVLAGPLFGSASAQ